ncbi:MAG: tetratricopeptide repeat protein, partial [Gammaproteobacteria bacterium]|nr:tetratricopeptide repeat protein [Gammaproteobacteria bacterium]
RTIGDVYQSLGLSAEARERLEHALRLQQEHLDDEHLEIATTMTILASVLANPYGEMEQARRYYRRALDIRRNRLGVDHVDVAASMNALGNVLHVMGDAEEAL